MTRIPSRNPVSQISAMRPSMIDAGVENLVGLLRRTFAAENTAKRRQIEQIAFVGANNHTDVGHQEKNEKLDE